jgi:hypothetical protein
MGSISTKPRHKPVAVNNAALLTAAGSMIALIAAAAMKRRVGSPAPSTGVKALTSLPALSRELATSQSRHVRALKAQGGFNELEVIKQSALLAVAESSALASGTTAFDAPVKALVAADSPSAALRAQAQFFETIRAGHQQAQIANFRVVAANAFRRIGFASVEELPGTDDKLRLVGRDAAGRTLVTEFETHHERGESVSSEVLGVCHSQSEELLGAFEKALEEEGVIGQPPTRRRTGGVAQLEAARAFIRRPVSKTLLPGHEASKSDEADRKRAQQNNRRNQQRQK